MTETVPAESLTATHPLGRALLAGTIVAVVDATMTLSTGFVSGKTLLLDFAVLWLLFGGIGFLAGLVARGFKGNAGIIDSGLIIAALLAFESRGWKCLAPCVVDLGPKYVAVAIVVVSAATFFVTALFRHALAVRVFFPFLSAVSAIAAADFASRDAAAVDGATTFLRAVCLIAFGWVVTLADQRGAKAAIAVSLVSASVFTFLPEGYLISRIAPPRAGLEEGAPAVETGSKHPNVLLIVLDTVRARDTSLYGYKRQTTPGLENLAREGLVFDHAISSGNYSLTSHASLFTGLLPTQHGAHSMEGVGVRRLGNLYADTALREDVTTVAERLRDIGYDTAGISANYAYLARWTGLQRGYRTFYDRSRHRIAFHPFVYPLLARYGTPVPQTVHWDADSITAGALVYANATRQPFFLFLNYFDAHDPYEQHPGHDFRGDGLDADHPDVAAYDSEIAYLDSSVSRLIDGLRASGRLDDTLLIVTSDHGEFIGEHGFQFHKIGAYEEVLHVPLLIRYPPRFQPGRVPGPFGINQVPAIIENVVSGGTLDWIHAPSGEPQVLAQIWGLSTRNDPSSRNGVDAEANVIYEGRHKLIDRATGQDELYDLERDPEERRNLLIDSDEQIQRRHERMSAASLRLPKSRPGTAPTADRQSLDSLRGLGYIDPIRK